MNILVDMDGESFKNLLFTRSEIKELSKEIYVEYWGEGDISKQEAGCHLVYDNNISVRSDGLGSGKSIVIIVVQIINNL